MLGFYSICCFDRSNNKKWGFVEKQIRRESHCPLFDEFILLLKRRGTVRVSFLANTKLFYGFRRETGLGTFSIRVVTGIRDSFRSIFGVGEGRCLGLSKEIYDAYKYKNASGRIIIRGAGHHDIDKQDEVFGCAVFCTNSESDV